MEDRTQLDGPGGAPIPPLAVPSAGGAVAAWLAEYGMVSLLPTEESPLPDDQPEAAIRVRLSAQKLWAEGRANPVTWACRSWIGDWQTTDRVSWRTTDGVWLAQLQRSPNGRRVMLCLWRGQSFVGYQDDAVWHPASARTRHRQPRPLERSLPLPLPLAG